MKRIAGFLLLLSFTALFLCGWGTQVLADDGGDDRFNALLFGLGPYHSGKGLGMGIEFGLAPSSDGYSSVSLYVNPSMNIESEDAVVAMGVNYYFNGYFYAGGGLALKIDPEITPGVDLRAGYKKGLGSFMIDCGYSSSQGVFLCLGIGK